MRPIIYHLGTTCITVSIQIFKWFLDSKSWRFKIKRLGPFKYNNTQNLFMRQFCRTIFFNESLVTLKIINGQTSAAQTPVEYKLVLIASFACRLLALSSCSFRRIVGLLSYQESVTTKIYIFYIIIIFYLYFFCFL